MNLHELLRHLKKQAKDLPVSQALSIDRRTVSRYRKWALQHKLLEGPLPPLLQLHLLVAQTLQSQPPPQVVSSVEPFRKVVALKEQDPNIEGTAIFQRLRERGYTGTRSSVYRFLNRLDPPDPAAKDTVRVERQPGEQAQVDFGYAGLLIDEITEELRKAWFFVMTLAYSRQMFVEFVFKQSLSKWIVLHGHTFEFFDGSPQAQGYLLAKLIYTHRCVGVVCQPRSEHEITRGGLFNLEERPEQEILKVGFSVTSPTMKYSLKSGTVIPHDHLIYDVYQLDEGEIVSGKTCIPWQNGRKWPMKCEAMRIGSQVFCFFHADNPPASLDGNQLTLPWSI
jgi:hypothetical protein